MWVYLFLLPQKVINYDDYTICFKNDVWNVFYQPLR